jgi:lipopolysaccharide export system protein LptC
VRRLAEIGRDHDLELDPDPEDEQALLSRLKQKTSELTGRFHEPGLLLLAELRHLHRVAAGVSLDWEVLAQTAQAMRDVELLELAEDCHPETLRQMRWANAQVKETAAQIMVTG